MRIDFSEPECSTCFYYRTSGILNPQESEPLSNVIASSVTSTPVSSEPVQALGHDSAAAVGSTSTSSPAQALGHDSAAAVGSTSLSSPAQALGNDSAAAVASTSTSSPAQAPGHDSATAVASTSTPSPVHSSSPVTCGFTFGSDVTSVSSAPTQAHGSTTSIFDPAVTSVSSAPTQPFGPNTLPSLWSNQAPGFGFSRFAAPTPFAFGRSMEAPTSSPPPIFSFPPPVTSVSSAFLQHPHMPPFSNRPAQDLGKTASDSPSLFRNGVDLANHTGGYCGPNTSPSLWSVQAPVQAKEPSTSRSFGFWPAQDLGKPASASPSVFRNGVDFARPDVGISPRVNTSSYTVVFGTTPVSISSPVGPRQDSVFTTGYKPTIPSSVFPGFGVGYLPGSTPAVKIPLFSGPIIGNDNIARRWDVRERGSGNPRYAPTPADDVGVTGGMISSISASFTYQNKSHEELRWEDYKKGEKGGSLPAAHISNFMGAAQRPHETIAVSSPASGCTACGATSSSSASGHVGFNNVATSPPLSAPPGLFFSTSGSCPVMFGTTNLAAQGATTTPAPLPAYPIMFGTTNLAAQGTTTTPAPLQAYPTMFGVNLAAQGTTTIPAFQAYPTMFGTNLAAQGATTPAPLQAYPNLAALGLRTTPVLQAYPTMFGTNFAAQGTTTPAPLQAYPNLAALGITTTPALQAYPTMYGTNVAAQGITTTPAVQAYPMMFGSNPAVQVTSPSVQGHPVHGLILLPFAAMNLQ